MVADVPFMQAGNTGPAPEVLPGSREVGSRKGPVQAQDILSKSTHGNILGCFMGDLIVVDHIVSSCHWLRKHDACSLTATSIIA